MRPGLRLSILLAGLVLGLAPVLPDGAFGQDEPRTIPEQTVRKMMELGLRNIHRALCDGFNQCAPATPEEMKNPPLSVDQARVAMLGGTRTALAGWCGFDANRRSVLPLLRQLRQGRQLNDRQVALMAVIHGIQQGIVAKQLNAQGSCDEKTRSRLDGQLPKR